MSRIYLDYNATAPMKPAALTATQAALALCGNPSSVHGDGRAARAAVERARSAVAALVGAREADVVFTSGGTESNNAAIRGLLDGAQCARILVSAVEHPSILACAKAQKPPCAEIPCDALGRIDLDWLEENLRADPALALVCVMLANNETGVIQPVAEAARLTRAAGGVFLCDAVQGPGRMAVDLGAIGADALTLSAHKFGGPKGVGAIVLREGAPFVSRLKGGGQERGYRAGTENVAGVAGFGAAAAEAGRDAADAPRLAALRDRLEAGVKAAAPGAAVFGEGAERLPNTSCVAAPGFASETQVMALDLDGISISSGSACSSGKVEPSHVLAAMGAGDDLSACAVRVSLGWASTEDDMDAFIGAWGAAYERAVMRRKAS